jgi:hypothetical protein
MELQIFHTELLQAVRSRAESTSDFLPASFVEECGNRLSEAEEFSEFQSCRFEGVSNRKNVRVNGYALDDVDNSLSLIIGDFHNEDEIVSFNTAQAEKAFSSLISFVEEALAGELTDGSIDESQPGYGLACDLMDWNSKITKYKLYLFSDALLKTRKKDWSVENIAGIPVELHIWDVGRLHSAHISATGRDELLVDFCRGSAEGLPCLAAAESEGEYKAYLCMIPGDLLADVYETYGSRLLEGNVRTFLSTKGKVNSKIQATIKNQPEMFFAFNNGIAATAEAVELHNGAQGLLIKNASNLQIVNGGQTTASLAFAKRGGANRKDPLDISRVWVPMKLSVLPPDKVGDLTPEIARYANSQNKVSDADFFSNHAYHIRLEEFSRRLFAPAVGGAQHGTHWFYERARGQYTNEQAKLSNSLKQQFVIQNPRKQLLSKTDVAKFENTWKELPHRVSMGAQKNFMYFADYISKSWASDGKAFNEEYFRSIIAIAIIFRAVESLVSQQDWYQGGYRANIVTYSISKLHNLVAEQALGKQVNLRLIWDKQIVPAPVIDQLKNIMIAVFSVLTDPDRPKDNVTEWAKTQACWDQVKELEVPLLSSFVDSLQDIKAMNMAEVTAKDQQKIDDGIAMQIAVVGIPKVEWNRMLTWGLRKSLITPRQESLLKLALLIPEKIPSEKQSAELWRVREHLINEGYISL